MAQRAVRIDESLEEELKRIQEKLKQQNGIEFSQNQASQIAAKILRENPTKININILKFKRGNRAKFSDIL